MKSTLALLCSAVASATVCAQLAWNTDTGFFGAAENWIPVQQPSPADDVQINNGGTATVFAGQNAEAKGVTLGQPAGGGGTLSMDGGTLALAGVLNASNGAGAESRIRLDGPSTILSTANISLGSRGTNLTEIGSAAVVRANVLRVGLYGPDMNESNAGTGIFRLSGTAEVARVIVASNGGAGEFILDGGTLLCSGGFDMGENPHLLRRSASLTVDGSSGSFYAGSFNAAGAPGVAINFKADAGGVAALNVAGAIHLDGAVLNVDLGAYSGPWTSMVLMDGASLAGTLSSVNIVGGPGGEQVVYDTANGNLVLASGTGGKGGLMFSVLSLPYRSPWDNPNRIALMDRTEEKAQHLLAAQGARFRFCRENLTCNDWSMTRFDLQEATDPEPSLRIVDTSETASVLLSLHKFLAIQPFTRYRLSFKSKLVSFAGGASPSVEVHLYDFTRDFIRSYVMQVPSGEAGQGWLEKQMDFIADHETHAMKIRFRSPGNTVCDVVFDEVYLEQVSDAGAERPEGRTLVFLESTANGELVRQDLLPEEGAARFQMELHWSPGADEPRLAFEWLAADGAVIGKEACTFSRFPGVRPVWSGVQAEWFREYGDSADPVHMRRDRFYDASPGLGEGRLDGMLFRPPGAAGLRVWQAGAGVGGIGLRNFSLVAQPLEVP